MTQSYRTSSEVKYDTAETEKLKTYLELFSLNLRSKTDDITLKSFLHEVGEYINLGADPNIKTDNGQSWLPLFCDLIISHYPRIDVGNARLFINQLNAVMKQSTVEKDQKPQVFARAMLYALAKSRWDKNTVNDVAQFIKEDAIVNPAPPNSIWWDSVLNRLPGGPERQDIFLLNEINKHYSDFSTLNGYIYLQDNQRQQKIVPFLYQKIMEKGQGKDSQGRENISYYSRPKLENLALVAKHDLLLHIKDDYQALREIADAIVKANYDPKKVTHPMAYLLLTPRYLTAVDRNSSSIKLLDELLRAHASTDVPTPSPFKEVPPSLFTRCLSCFWTPKPVEKSKTTGPEQKHQNHHGK